MGREVAGETLQVSYKLPFRSLGTQSAFRLASWDFVSRVLLLKTRPSSLLKEIFKAELDLLFLGCQEVLAGNELLKPKGRYVCVT